MGPSGPLHLAVTDLLHRPGSQRRVTAPVAVEGLEMSIVQVPANGQVDVDLTLEAQGGGMLTVTGWVTAPWEGECRRCLRAVRGETTTQVQEVFERHPTLGETYPLADEQVDLEPMVREAVLLALPLAPLCEAACQGPVPDQYPVAVEDEEQPPDRDPRWAALDELTFDDDE